MAGRTRAAEDLNLIVNRQYDRAAAHADLPAGLLEQTKICNNVFCVQFPVKFGKEYHMFQAWRAEHSHHKKPLKGGIRPAGPEPPARLTDRA